MLLSLLINTLTRRENDPEYIERIFNMNVGPCSTIKAANTKKSINYLVFFLSLLRVYLLDVAVTRLSIDLSAGITGAIGECLLFFYLFSVFIF